MAARTGTPFLYRLLPAWEVLGRVFRGKFIAGLKSAFRGGKLEFHGHLASLAEPPLLRRLAQSSVP